MYLGKLGTFEPAPRSVYWMMNLSTDEMIDEIPLQSIDAGTPVFNTIRPRYMVKEVGVCEMAAASLFKGLGCVELPWRMTVSR